MFASELNIIKEAYSSMVNKPELFFRFTTNDGIGIYQSVKNEIFSNFKNLEKAKKIWKKFINSDNITWLNRPDSYPDNTYSWFTEEGKDKFEKLSLPEITKFIDASKIKKITSKHPGKIIYKDKYQIFVSS